LMAFTGDRGPAAAGRPGLRLVAAGFVMDLVALAMRAMVSILRLVGSRRSRLLSLPPRRVSTDECQQSGAS
jgi:hypothetical protein